MPKIVAFALLLFVSFATPDFVKASDTQRIEEMLARDTYSEDGNLLLSTTRATVAGCTIQLELDRVGFCERTGGYGGVTSLIDVRALLARQDQARLKDFTGTSYESLSGAVTYRYRPIYNRMLGFANLVERRIRDEEIARFPHDADARMEALCKRYREGIDPRSYSMSVETTHWCSGVDVTGPMRSGRFDFFVRPEDQLEFTALIEKLAQTCEGGPLG